MLQIQACNPNKIGAAIVVLSVGMSPRNRVFREAHMEKQRAEVFWTCACGSKEKANLDMTKTGVTIQCPNPPCKVMRTLPGQITQLFVETAPGMWTEVDVSVY